jgi:hypothetical protein
MRKNRRGLTRQQVPYRSQSEENFGANPLDGAELDAGRIRGKVNVEDDNFLSDTGSASIYLLTLPRCIS